MDRNDGKEYMDKNFLRQGKLVSLRMIDKEDTPLIVSWRNNERIKNHFIYREFFTADIHENWLKNMVGTGKVVQMIICENENDYRPVGSVYFRYSDDDKTEAEYGIFIGEDDATGKGYGNETAILAVDYARKELDLKKLMLRVFTYNVAAIKSYENAGFRKTADLPMVECSDGQKSDMILMELK